MEKKTINRSSLSKQVADQLEQMITDGVYAVGKKIPTEPELTEMFSVSRNTLREAIQSLTSAGILTVKQGDGTYVRSNNRFHAHMSLEYEQVSLEDILVVRNALENTISTLASQHRTEEDLIVIKKALDKRQNQTDGQKENTKADIEFHMAISKACHNKILEDLYSSISTYLEDHITQRQASTKMATEEIDALHEKLFLAIKAKNQDEARNCAEDILKI